MQTKKGYVRMWQVPKKEPCALLGGGECQRELLDSLGIPRGKEIFAYFWSLACPINTCHAMVEWVRER